MSEGTVPTPERDERPPGASTAARVVLVGACGLLALATVHLWFHWALYTDAMLRRLLQ